MYVLLGNSLSASVKDAFNALTQTNDSFKILNASLGKFVSGEAFSEIIPEDQELHNQPVIVVQSLGGTVDHTANDYAMETLMTVDTLKRNNAGPIWVIAPFLAYGRQDRPFGGRMTSVGVETFGKLLSSVGAVGLSTVDLHSQAGLTLLKGQLGEDSVYDLPTSDLFAHEISKLKLQDIVAGGPDSGAHERAHRVAEKIGADRFEIDKKHLSANQTQVRRFEGDVSGRATVTVDDMIDTGGTIANAQVRLAELQAVKRIVVAAHGIFSKGGLEKLFTTKTSKEQPAIDRLFISDTIDVSEKIASLSRQYGKAVKERIRVVSVGSLLADHAANDILVHPAMRVA